MRDLATRNDGERNLVRQGDTMIYDFIQRRRRREPPPIFHVSLRSMLLRNLHYKVSVCKKPDGKAYKEVKCSM